MALGVYEVVRVLVSRVAGAHKTNQRTKRLTSYANDFKAKRRARENPSSARRVILLLMNYNFRAVRV